MSIKIVRPNGDISTPWGTATPHYSKIDDNKTIDDTIVASNDNIQAGKNDDNEEERFDFETFKGVYQIEKVIVHINHRRIGSLDNPTITIKMNGADETNQTISDVSAAPVWSSFTFSSVNQTWNQDDLNNIEVAVKTGNISNSSSFTVHIIYIDVYFTPLQVQII